MKARKIRKNLNYERCNSSANIEALPVPVPVPVQVPVQVVGVKVVRLVMRGGSGGCLERC